MSLYKCPHCGEVLSHKPNTYSCPARSNNAPRQHRSGRPRGVSANTMENRRCVLLVLEGSARGKTTADIADDTGLPYKTARKIVLTLSMSKHIKPIAETWPRRYVLP